MPTDTKPNKLTVRMYNVGFGDCFLLTFHYATKQRHVLIDFGSTKSPHGDGKKLAVAIAKDIKAKCSGKLDAVVSTHRHEDHISGFATTGSGESPGKIIAGLNPEVVVQPWTEDPDAKRDANKPTKAFIGLLDDMHSVAAGALANLRFLTGADRAVLDQLAFIGEDGLKNLSAVQNLMTMGKKRRYVYFDSDSGLGAALPGVRVRVLGPPTLEQSKKIRTQRLKDPVEFWQLAAGSAHLTASGGRLFPRARTGGNPIWARWFRQRLHDARAETLLQLVRILDKAMNNTSVILLFEAGSKRLLFPGDAQIENWAFALGKADVQKALAKVDLYKVGHHGSLNATPKKSLWPLFTNKSATKKPSRLKTVMSTIAGKHGHLDSNTEVPRRTLVKELQAESDLLSTESYGESELSRTVEVDLG